MICPPCREQRHKRCDDIGHQRLYRSCDCQHKGEVQAEPATGPAGE